MAANDDPQALVDKYIGDTTRTYDVAREAFEQGVEYFKTELTHDKVKRDWIDEQTSMLDVLTVAKDARCTYQASRSEHGPISRWASRLPDQIMYYGSVLDVFVQSHPEVAALAWGAMKFVLMGVIDNARLFAKIAEALTLVGESLQRVELYSKLYSASEILPIIARLYGHILLFLKKAIKWYQANRWWRAFKSVSEPYDIGYKATVDQIRACTASLDTAADSAAKVELRGVTLMQTQSVESLNAVDGKLRQLQNAFAKYASQLSLMEGKLDNVCQVTSGKIITLGRFLGVNSNPVSGTYALSHQISADVLDNKESLRDLQLAEILNELGCSGNAHRRLNESRALSKRRQSWQYAGQESLNLVNTIRRWASSNSSALLVVQGSPLTEAKLKDLAVSVVDYGQAAGASAIWALSENKKPRSPSTDRTLLWKTLIAQALRHNPECLSHNGVKLSALQFKVNHSDNEWRTLFSQVVSKLSKCVIVIEASDIFEGFGYDPARVRDFISMFQLAAEEAAKQGSAVKIFIASYCSDRSAIANLSTSGRAFTAFLARPRLVNKRATKRARVVDRKARRTVVFN
ncbi:uncharacterized protein HMPREF1541_03001 [Cyphellophora europaea CBS 101466]|uniref:DUF7708 domain-containing protein n=1 Tax=Cyphellophora europaea (strain CBS 101466) TaxID=1220924 RepID=W2RX31_CYPE1|nr:uncharacterized protein HMPREF1541_03001 [Cyphellophora europaea CBS 101466]ETN41066.1 hypothetical protein HMPREF1541_03001 [Cyphellophora europaea CBS 101466]